MHFAKAYIMHFLKVLVNNMINEKLVQKIFIFRKELMNIFKTYILNREKKIYVDMTHKQQNSFSHRIVIAHNYYSTYILALVHLKICLRILQMQKEAGYLSFLLGYPSGSSTSFIFFF